MIQPILKKAEVHTQAEYIITVTWPLNNADDVDVWLEDRQSGEKTKVNEGIYTFVAVLGIHYVQYVVIFDLDPSKFWSISCPFQCMDTIELAFFLAILVISN